MARIVSVGTAVPPFRLDGAGFKDALTSAFADHFDDLRPLLRMAERCGVRERYIAAPVDEILRPRTLTDSNSRYAELAVELGEVACREALSRAGVEARAIDLIVSVSCTGYMLPSLDAHLVSRLGLRPNVRRLPITELGCLAGAAALARANEWLVPRSGGVALVVSAELPSLTFQRGDGSMDNLVSTLVFGDGAGAAVLRADETAGFEIVASRSYMVPDSLDHMGFDLRTSGFHVVLTKDVPTLLSGPFAAEVSALFAEHKLTPLDLGFACIHPGGPRILRAVDEALGVEGLTAPSWDVLSRFGNQSSAAVFFIADEIRRTVPLSDGAWGLLAGFGPGLSLELSLLQWHG